MRRPGEGLPGRSHDSGPCRPAMHGLRRAAAAILPLAFALFSGLAPGAAGAQSVTDVSFWSDPGSDNTYVAGDVIQVNVSYDSGLAVTGAPRLPLKIGDTTKYAAYSTGDSYPHFNNGLAILRFEYTVQAGDNDTDGIGVPGPVDLNGGSIRKFDDSADAGLALGTHAITNDAGHKVSTPKPGLTISTSTATITEGDEISITVTRDTTVGTAAAAFNVNFTVAGGSAFGWPDGVGASVLVAFADGSTTGTFIFAVTEDMIPSASGNHDVTITLAAGHSYTVGTANSVGVTVEDNDSAPGAPGIVSITPQDRALLVAWSLPADLGRIDGAAVGFGQILDVDLQYRRAGETDWIDYSHNWSGEQSPIQIKGIDLSTCCGLEDTRLDVDAAYEVRMRLEVTDYGEWSAAATGRTLAADAPTVTALSVSSDPGSDDTYGVGDEIVVDVTFDAELDVTGTPRLGIYVGGTGGPDIRRADYDAAGSLPTGIANKGFLRFRYTVRAGDADADGISIADATDATAIDATGASIRKHCSRSANAQTPYETCALYANLDIGDLGFVNDPDHKVDTPATVPLAPDVTGVEVSAFGRTLSFRWRSQMDVLERAPVTGYRVEMRSAQPVDGTYEWTKVGSDLPAPVDPGTSDNVFTEYNVPWETTRHYRVFALSRAGDSPASDPVSGTTPARADVPGKVTGVTVTPGAGELAVGWTAVTPATGYLVQWKSGTEQYSGMERRAMVTGTSYTITGLTAGTAYDVQVTAINNAVSGTPSATVRETVPAVGGTPPLPQQAQPPLAPTGLVGSADGETTIALSWTAPTGDSTRATVTGYRVEWSADGSSGWTTITPSLPATASSYRNTGLIGGTTRYYRVFAVSDAGESPASDTVSATTDVALSTNPVEVPDEDGDPVRVTSGDGVTLKTERRDTDGDGDLDTVLTFMASEDSPLNGLTVTLPEDTGTGNTRTVTATTQAPPEGVEPPDGVERPDDMTETVVDLSVPVGSRVCLPFDRSAGSPVIYRFDGTQWERETVMDQAVEGGLVCGTVTATSLFAVFYNRKAALAGATNAWLARFGRTVADQAIEAVGARLEAVPQPGSEVRFVGHRMGGEVSAAAQEACSDEFFGDGAGVRMGGYANRTNDLHDRCRIETLGMTGQELLTGSSFQFTGGNEETGYSTVWASGAVTRFDGSGAELDLGGEVTSAMLGADFTRDRSMVGLALVHSRGDGSLRGAVGGSVESTLTGLYPYGRYRVNDRLSLWGIAGYGEGSMTLTPVDADGTSQAAIRSDLDLMMAAVGVRSTLVEAPETGGMTLAVRADAMGVRTRLTPVTGSGNELAAADADVTRLRLGIEGTWPGIETEGGATLTPTLELGLRHDGGDAETGFGVEVGAGIAWSDPTSGFEVDIRARALLAHEDGGFRERGLSGSLVWDPAPGSDRGPSMTLTQTLGVSAKDGVDRLFREGVPAELAANDNGLDARNFGASLGYGIGAFGDRFTMTPELDFGLSDAGRDYRVGWRLNPSGGYRQSFELRLSGTRSETVNDNGPVNAPEHKVGIEFRTTW